MTVSRVQKAREDMMQQRRGAPPQDDPQGDEGNPEDDLTPEEKAELEAEEERQAEEESQKRVQKALAARRAAAQRPQPSEAIVTDEDAMYRRISGIVAKAVAPLNERLGRYEDLMNKAIIPALDIISEQVGDGNDMHIEIKKALSGVPDLSKALGGSGAGVPTIPHPVPNAGTPTAQASDALAKSTTQHPNLHGSAHVDGRLNAEQENEAKLLVEKAMNVENGGTAVPGFDMALSNRATAGVMRPQDIDILRKGLEQVGVLA